MKLGVNVSILIRNGAEMAENLLTYVSFFVLHFYSN